MKGLLKKDIFVLRRTLLTFLLACLVFLAISVTASDSMMFLTLPSLMCGVVPISFLSYDERSHWMEFSSAMPIRRGQFVGAKYLLGAALMVLFAVLALVVHLIAGIYESALLLALLPVTLGTALIVSAISLPLMFRFGVEKGRLWYYLILLIIGGSSGFLVALDQEDVLSIMHTVSPWLILLIGAVIYAISWWLSIKLFERREF